MCLPCSLPVRVAPSSAARALQVRRRSPRGAELGSGAQADQAPPHHFHRGAAGRAGGAVPAEPVSGRKHQGEAGTERTPEGGESGGTFGWSVSGSVQCLEMILLPCRLTSRLSKICSFKTTLHGDFHLFLFYRFFVLV